MSRRGPASQDELAQMEMQFAELGRRYSVPEGAFGGLPEGSQRAASYWQEHKDYTLVEEPKGLNWLLDVLDGAMEAEPRCFLPFFVAFVDGLPAESKDPTQKTVLSSLCVAACIQAAVRIMEHGLAIYLQEEHSDTFVDRSPPVTCEDMVFAVLYGVCLPKAGTPLEKDLIWLHMDGLSERIFAALPESERSALATVFREPQKAYSRYQSHKAYQEYLYEFRPSAPTASGELSPGSKERQARVSTARALGASKPFFANMVYRLEYRGRDARQLLPALMIPQLVRLLGAMDQMLVCQAIGEMDNDAMDLFRVWTDANMLPELAPEPMAWCMQALKTRSAVLEAWFQTDGDKKLDTLLGSQDPGVTLEESSPLGARLLLKVCQALLPGLERLEPELRTKVRRLGKRLLDEVKELDRAHKAFGESWNAKEAERRRRRNLLKMKEKQQAAGAPPPWGVGPGQRRFPTASKRHEDPVWSSFKMEIPSKLPAEPSPGGSPFLRHRDVWVPQPLPLGMRPAQQHPRPGYNLPPPPPPDLGEIEARLRRRGEEGEGPAELVPAGKPVQPGSSSAPHDSALSAHEATVFASPRAQYPQPTLRKFLEESAGAMGEQMP